MAKPATQFRNTAMADALLRYVQAKKGESRVTYAAFCKS